MNAFENKIEKIPLNRHVIKKVKPQRCLVGHDKHTWDGFNSEFCDKCNFCIGDECVFEKYITNASAGSYDQYDDKHWIFIHWNCANCGELIKIQNYISYIDEDLKQQINICEHCKTPHKFLKSGDDFKYDGGGEITFAVPLCSIRSD